MMLRLALAISMSLLLPTPALFAVIVSGEPGNGTTVPGQPIYGVNHDGVGLLGWSVPDDPIDPFWELCSASLITDRHILTAAHCAEWYDDDFAVRFELAGGDVQIPILPSIHIMPDWEETWSDVAVLQLAKPAPSALPRYPLYGRTDEIGKPIVIVGYGDTGHGSTGEGDPFGNPFDPDKHAARNRYEVPAELLDPRLFGPLVDPSDPEPFPTGVAAIYDFDSGLEENNSLAVWGFASDLGFGAEEGMSYFGDSGGPEFIDGAIAGVISFGIEAARGADVNEDPFDGSWGEVSGSILVSSFRDFIMQATDGEAVFWLAADFDVDGDVDGDDFLIWQSSFSNNDSGDADGDGDTDGDDFLIWQTQFGSGNGSASAAVPEPPAIVLILVALVGRGFLARRH